MSFAGAEEAQEWEWGRTAPGCRGQLELWHVWVEGPPSCLMQQSSSACRRAGEEVEPVGEASEKPMGQFLLKVKLRYSFTHRVCCLLWGRHTLVPQYCLRCLSSSVWCPHEVAEGKKQRKASVYRPHSCRRVLVICLITLDPN